MSRNDHLSVTCPSCGTIWDLTPEETHQITVTCEDCQTTFEITSMVDAAFCKISLRKAGWSLAAATFILTTFFVTQCMYECVTTYTDYDLGEQNLGIDKGDYRVFVFATDRTGTLDEQTPKGGFTMQLVSKSTHQYLRFKLISAEYSLNGLPFNALNDMPANVPMLYLVPAIDSSQPRNRYDTPVIPQGTYLIRLKYSLNGKVDQIEVQRTFRIRTFIQKRRPVIIDG
jgi:hypothetical protein